MRDNRFIPIQGLLFLTVVLCGGQDTAQAAPGGNPGPPTDNVNVVNTSSNPVPVTITTLEPFNACLTFSGTGNGTLLTVPSGKLAVIEYVEGTFVQATTFTDFPSLALAGINPGSGVNFGFSTVAQGNAGSSARYVANHVTKIYALPGTVLVAASSTGGSACISGHFEAAAP